MIRKSVKPKKASILDRAKPLEDLKVGLTALFYGRSGTGKTTILGTYPKPILVIDIKEKGTDSLLGIEGIDVIQVENWQDIEDIYWELKAGTKYKTVGIDALHTMQGMALGQAKINSGKKTSDQTSQRDFGQGGALVVEWCTNFRDLKDDGMSVVFLSHDKVSQNDTDDDTDTIMPEVGPRLMPAVASSITGMVNVVGNTYIRQTVEKSKRAGEKSKRDTQYCLRIGPHGYYSTKVRRPKEISIPEFIVDPSYDKLIGVIKGESSPTTKRKLRRK